MPPKETVTCDVCYGQGLRITWSKYTNDYGVMPCWLCDGSGKIDKPSGSEVDLEEFKGAMKISGTSIMIVNEELENAT
ncbi:MAG: hypothetical protein ACYSR0_00470 [Planctomycetota bacterium]|jgi:hypothetical protein